MRNLALLFILMFSCSVQRPDPLFIFGEGDQILVIYPQWVENWGQEGMLGLPFLPKEGRRVSGGLFLEGEGRGAFLPWNELKLIDLPGASDATLWDEKLFYLKPQGIFHKGILWASFSFTGDRFFFWEEGILLREKATGRWGYFKAEEDQWVEKNFPPLYGFLIPLYTSQGLLGIQGDELFLLNSQGRREIEKIEEPIFSWDADPHESQFMIYTPEKVWIYPLKKELPLKIGPNPQKGPLGFSGVEQKLLFWEDGPHVLDLESYQIIPFSPHQER